MFFILFILIVLPFCLYYNRTVQCRQEVKWERKRGAGSGKVLELGCCTEQHYLSAHYPLGQWSTPLTYSDRTPPHKCGFLLMTIAGFYTE